MKITLKNLQNKLCIPEKRVKSLALKVLAGEKAAKIGWINICFVDNAQIRKFNAKFLKADCVTDVLAFDLSGPDDKGKILADIIISAEAAVKQSAFFKTTPDKEVLLYVTHGILHILGFRDKTKTQIQLMRKKESLYVD